MPNLKVTLGYEQAHRNMSNSQRPSGVFAEMSTDSNLLCCDSKHPIATMGPPTSIARYHGKGTSPDTNTFLYDENALL